MTFLRSRRRTPPAGRSRDDGGLPDGRSDRRDHAAPGEPLPVPVRATGTAPWNRRGSLGLRAQDRIRRRLGSAGLPRGRRDACPGVHEPRRDHRARRRPRAGVPARPRHHLQGLDRHPGPHLDGPGRQADGRDARHLVHPDRQSRWPGLRDGSRRHVAHEPPRQRQLAVLRRRCQPKLRHRLGHHHIGDVVHRL